LIGKVAHLRHGSHSEDRQGLLYLSVVDSLRLIEEDQHQGILSACGSLKEDIRLTLVMINELSPIMTPSVI